MQPFQTPSPSSLRAQELQARAASQERRCKLSGICVKTPKLVQPTWSRLDHLPLKPLAGVDVSDRLAAGSGPGRCGVLSACGIRSWPVRAGLAALIETRDFIRSGTWQGGIDVLERGVGSLGGPLLNTRPPTSLADLQLATGEAIRPHDLHKTQKTVSQ